MRALLACIVAAAISTALPCQTAKPATPATGGTKVDAPPPNGATPKPQPSIPPRVLRPGPGVGDTQLEAAKRVGAPAGTAHFHAVCTPNAVGAGGDGTLVVAMSLGGNAVMLDPPPVSFTFARQQGALTIVGEPKFRPPARPGTAPALKGLATYDDVAILDVPFAVAADAAEGPHRLELAIHYQLLDGKVGGVLGDFNEPVSIDVPVVRATAAPTVAANDVAAAHPLAGTGSRPVQADVGVQPGADTQVAPAAAPNAAAPRRVPPPASESSLLLPIGGGLLVAALLALVAMRALRAR